MQVRQVLIVCGDRFTRTPNCVTVLHKAVRKPRVPMATSVPCTLLEDLSNALPPLAKSIVAFTTTLASVVDKIVEYFDNEENSRHVAETTHEARTLCQQLLQIMILSDSYMDDVDTFAELAIDKRRQGEIVQCSTPARPDTAV